MNCHSERPVHLSSHIGDFAGVGATICQLGTKKKKEVIVFWEHRLQAKKGLGSVLPC